MYQQHGYWAVVSTLAHEVGHHVHGDTVGKSLFPGDEELAAEYFAGFALARMGAPLEDATAQLRTLKRVAPGYPDRQRLLDVLCAGWEAGGGSGQL